MPENTASWGRVRDDGSVQVGPPESGTLKDGTPVSNYKRLPEAQLKAEGWLPIEDEGDGDGEVSYRVENDKIIRTRHEASEDDGLVLREGEDHSDDARGMTPGARLLRVSPQQIANARTLQELKDALLANDAPEHAFRS